MNLKKINSTVTILFVFLSLVSCSGSDDVSVSPAPTPSSREVKYTISGTATGNFSITYVSATGGGTNEAYSALPYTKEFTAQTNVPSVSFTTGVTGAVPGQTMQVKIFIGGEVKRENEGVVGTNGTLVLTLPAYVF